ncbi:conserved membrane hypothetical protein [Flavobacterium psychrophilum]|uniref:DUF6688 domain-containing protein n=1 Tax=Flavobacterium psychrophilum TaxID=96345 RepID=UPI000B7C107F|nr:DUF6688 family protein [Flavobacterium psychrophilum]SNB25745.1 conserved membrane hypothetical protein [Flavobacterium psychrophilum]
MVLIVIIIFISFIALSIAGLKLLKKGANSREITIATFYIFSIALFAIGMTTHSNSYYKAIDPVDMECYSPFSDKNAITLIFYTLVFNISLLLVWVKGNILPPLALTLSLIFILIGTFLNIGVLFQISVHNTETLNTYNSRGEQILFLFAPLFSVILGVYFIYKATTQEIKEAFEKAYSNKIINALNTFLSTKSRNPFWIVLLMFPVFFIVTLLLILFGQDTNSIIKVFTDTATWKFSQQVHPPILDHKGHYLCTVATSGHPKIVKPIRFGKRNGNRIIVNRQLLIANAFEEMIQDISPRLHFKIRTIYDQYGYNLSKKINTTFLASATYILMKPLEWIFLICLYLICNKPEQKINKQYAQ